MSSHRIEFEVDLGSKLSVNDLRKQYESMKEDAIKAFEKNEPVEVGLKVVGTLDTGGTTIDKKEIEKFTRTYETAMNKALKVVSENIGKQMSDSLSKNISKEISDGLSAGLDQSVKEKLDSLFHNFETSFMDSFERMQKNLISNMTQNQVYLNLTQGITIDSKQDLQRLQTEADQTAQQIIDIAEKANEKINHHKFKTKGEFRSAMLAKMTEVKEIQAELDNLEDEISAMDSVQKEIEIGISIKQKGGKESTYDTSVIAGLKSDQEKAGKEIAELYQVYVDNLAELDKVEKEMKTKKTKASKAEYDALANRAEMIRDNMDRVVQIVHEIDASKESVANTIKAKKDPLFLDDFLNGFMQINTKDSIASRQKELEGQLKATETSLRNYRRKNLELWKEVGLDGDTAYQSGGKTRATMTIHPVLNEDKIISETKKVLQKIQDEIKKQPIEVDIIPQDQVYDTIAIGIQQGFEDLPLNIKINEDYIKEQLKGILGEVNPQESEPKKAKKSKRKSKNDVPVEELKTEAGTLVSLEEKVDDVTAALDLKTEAIINEEEQMRSSVGKEIAALTHLQNKLKEVADTISEMPSLTLTGDMSGVNVVVNGSGSGAPSEKPTSTGETGDFFADIMATEIPEQFQDALDSLDDFDDDISDSLYDIGLGDGSAVIAGAVSSIQEKVVQTAANNAEQMAQNALEGLWDAIDNQQIPVELQDALDMLDSDDGYFDYLEDSIESAYGGFDDDDDYYADIQSMIQDAFSSKPTKATKEQIFRSLVGEIEKIEDDRIQQEEELSKLYDNITDFRAKQFVKTNKTDEAGNPIFREQKAKKRKGQKVLEDKIKARKYAEKKTAEGVSQTVLNISDEQERKQEIRNIQGIQVLMDKMNEVEKNREQTSQRITEYKEKEKELTKEISDMSKKLKQKGIRSFEDAYAKDEVDLFTQYERKQSSLSKVQGSIARSEEALRTYDSLLTSIPAHIQELKSGLKHVDVSNLEDADLYRASENITLESLKSQQEYAQALREEYFKIKPVLDKMEALRNAKGELEELRLFEDRLAAAAAASKNQDDEDHNAVLNEKESERYRALLKKQADNEKLISESASMEVLVAELDKSREGLVHLAKLTNENVMILDRAIRGKKSVKKLKESTEDQKARYLAEGSGKFKEYNDKYEKSREATGFGKDKGKKIDVRDIPLYRFYEKMKSLNQAYQDVSDLLDKESSEVAKSNTSVKVEQQKQRLLEISSKKKALKQKFDDGKIAQQPYYLELEQLQEQESIIKKELKMYQRRLSLLGKYNQQEIAEKVKTSQETVKLLDEKLKDEEYVEEQINRLRHGSIRNVRSLDKTKQKRTDSRGINDLYEDEIAEYKQQISNEINKLEHQRSEAQAALDKLAQMRQTEDARLKKSPNEPTIYDTKEYKELADNERQYQYTVEETTRQMTLLNEKLQDRKGLVKEALGNELADDFWNNDRYLKNTSANLDNVKLDLDEVCRLINEINAAKEKAATSGDTKDKLHLSKLGEQLKIVLGRIDWQAPDVRGYLQKYYGKDIREEASSTTANYAVERAYTSSPSGTAESVAELDDIIARVLERNGQLDAEIEQITQSFEASVDKIREGKGYTAETKKQISQMQYKVDRLKAGDYKKGENAENAAQTIASLEARIATLEKQIELQESDQGSKIYARHRAMKINAAPLLKRKKLIALRAHGERQLSTYRQQRDEEEALRLQLNPTEAEMQGELQGSKKNIRSIKSEYRKQTQEVKGQIGQLQQTYDAAQQEFDKVRQEVKTDNARLQAALEAKKQLLEEAAKKAGDAQGKTVYTMKENYDPKSPTHFVEQWSKEKRQFESADYAERNIESANQTLERVAENIRKEKEEAVKDMQRMSELLKEISEYQDKRKKQTQEHKKPTRELTVDEKKAAEEAMKKKMAEQESYAYKRRMFTELATKHGLATSSVSEVIKNGEEVTLDNLVAKSETILTNMQRIQTELQGFETDKISALDAYVASNRNTTDTAGLSAQVEQLSKVQGLIKDISEKQKDIDKSMFGKDAKVDEMNALYEELKQTLSSLGLNYDDLVVKQKQLNMSMGKTISVDELSFKSLSKSFETKKRELEVSRSIDSRVASYDSATTSRANSQDYLADYQRRLQLSDGQEGAIKYKTREELDKATVEQIKQAFLQEKVYYDEFIQAYDSKSTDIDLFVDELSEENHEHLVTMMRYINDLKKIMGNTDQFRQTLSEIGLQGYGNPNDTMYGAMAIAYDDASDQYSTTRKAVNKNQVSYELSSGEEYTKTREEVRAIEREIEANNQKLARQKKVVDDAQAAILSAEKNISNLEAERNKRIANATGEQAQRQLSYVASRYKTGDLFTEGLQGKVSSLTDVLPKAIKDVDSLSTEEILKLYDGYTAITKTKLDMLTEGSEETIKFLQDYLGDIVKRAKAKSSLTQKFKPTAPSKYTAADFAGKSEAYLTKKLEEAQEKAKGSGKRAADWQAKIPAIEEAIRLVKEERAEQDKLNAAVEETVTQEQVIVETKQEATSTEVTPSANTNEVDIVETTAQIEQETQALNENTAETHENTEAKEELADAHEELEQQIQEGTTPAVSVGENSNVNVVGNANVGVQQPVEANTSQVEQETAALEQNRVATDKNVESKEREIATYEELEDEINDVVNATRVAIAEGSSVSIAGNVKVDTQQFTALTTGLSNMENVAKALLTVVTQIYAKIAHGASIASDAIYDASAPVEQILGQMENLEGVIDSVTFKMPKFGEGLSSVVVGDIDVDKFVGIKEAIDSIHEAVNSTVQDPDYGELYEFQELMKSSDVKATYKKIKVPKIDENNVEVTDPDTGLPVLEDREIVELTTKFRDAKNEVVELKYKYDLATETLTKGNKVVAKVSNKFTEQEQAIKKADAQLTYYTSKFDKLKVKFKTFHLDDFSFEKVTAKDGTESTQLVAKAGTEAQEVLSIMTDSTKKLVIKVLQDLGQIQTKFDDMRNHAKDGVFDPETFKATTSAFNEMIEQFEVDMNAVNRNVNTSVEHMSRNMLKSWQQDLANQRAWLMDSQGEFRIDTSGLNDKGLEYLRQYKVELEVLKKLYDEYHAQGKYFTDAQVQEWKYKMQDLADLKKLLYSNGAKSYVNGQGFTLEGKSISRDSFDQMTKSSQYARQVLSELAREYAGVDIEVVKLSKDNQELTYVFRDSDKNLQKHKISVQDFGKTIRNTMMSSTKHVGLFTLAWESLKEKLVQITRYVSAYQIFYKAVNAVRSGIEIVRELDRAMTEMRKVSKDSEAALLDFAKASHKVAQEIGSTAATIQNSAADWMRLGYSIKEAAELAKNTSILMNVSEFETIDEATESMVAMIQAFKDEGTDVVTLSTQIIDKLNNIGNNYSISTSQLAESLQRSSGTLIAASNTLDEAIALTTAGNAIIQDAETTGNALKVISMRIRGTTAEALEAEGEDAIGLIETTSKLEEKVKSLTAVNGKMGVSLTDANGNYRSTYEILQDIADVWEEIGKADLADGENRQAALLEILAGKTRAQALASILQNAEMLRDVYGDVQESEGSALHENEEYLKSIDAHMNVLTAKWQELWDSSITRDQVTWVVDRLGDIVDIVEKIGIGWSAVFAGGAALGINKLVKEGKKDGGGRAKMSVLIICHRAS